jgi:hypothetical protein
MRKIVHTKSLVELARSSINYWESAPYPRDNVLGSLLGCKPKGLVVCRPNWPFICWTTGLWMIPTGNLSKGVACNWDLQ